MKTLAAALALIIVLLTLAAIREQAVIDAQAASASSSLLYPRPRPVSEMSLAQLERFQVRAVSHYRGALAAHEKAAGRRTLNAREWTHRRFYRRAVVWTTDELSETRGRLVLRQADRDWGYAVRYAERIYPGSRGWLLSCSSTEGGHGGWVPNREGSRAGGWMQFLSGTFYANVDAALSDARRRGFAVPTSWRSWYSPGGQAVTAAYMLRIGQRGQWQGSGC